jgi:hypothetical protein
MVNQNVQRISLDNMLAAGLWRLLRPMDTLVKRNIERAFPATIQREVELHPDGSECLISTDHYGRECIREHILYRAEYVRHILRKIETKTVTTQVDLNDS